MDWFLYDNGSVIKELNVCIIYIVKLYTLLYTKRSVDMHFVRTCTIIFILTFIFFNQSVSQKKL